MTNEIQQHQQQQVFALQHSTDFFELIQRKATAFSKSNIVPKTYQNNVPNCIVAMEIAHRMNDASVLMIMQNLYIVHGSPAWSAQFIIGRVNTCGRFAPLQFRMQGKGESRSCVAYAKSLVSGDVLEGVEVSIAMAKAEGWYQKTGSKWQTMPEVMLMYRAASFFGKLYAPDVIMGMQSREELEDMIDVTPVGDLGYYDSEPANSDSVVDTLNAKVSKKDAPIIVDTVVDAPEKTTKEKPAAAPKADAQPEKQAQSEMPPADVEAHVTVNPETGELEARETLPEMPEIDYYKPDTDYSKLMAAQIEGAGKKFLELIAVRSSSEAWHKAVWVRLNMTSAVEAMKAKGMKAMLAAIADNSIYFEGDANA